MWYRNTHSLMKGGKKIKKLDIFYCNNVYVCFVFCNLIKSIATTFDWNVQVSFRNHPLL